jgi:hypothetical protein
MSLDAVVRRLSSKHRAFVETFLDKNGEPASGGPSAVLAHLQAFCRGDRSSVAVAADGHVDPYATCMAEGRREVWLEIQKYLSLNERSLHRWAGEIENRESIE